MTQGSYRFNKADRTLGQRLFEAPSVGKMSPFAKVVAYSMLAVWSFFVLFPIYWVVITSFKDAAAVNQGPYYLPFFDFQPTLEAWRTQFTEDPNCNFAAIARQFGLLVYNSFVWIVSPVVDLTPMDPQICKIYLAFTNSVVISIFSTGLCVIVGSMAAYALARITYEPRFGNIMIFVGLIVVVIYATTYAGAPWWAAATVALALFYFLARALRGYFKMHLRNGDILFWIISQRILPPIVIVIPIYVMFQAVKMLDTHLALILLYAVANMPIVVWLMHDFFANLPIELEESAQLDGATRPRIFWEIVLPLTRPGLAATTLLILVLSWNEYLFAVFLATVKVQTMPIMVAAKNAGEKGIFWWEMCAIIVVMIIPVIIMAILLTRFISRGVLMGAVKG
ncbi:Various polyols ABC transporter, permease component 2 [Candidatus Rhodobacter oscarellae]|uniref:Various polyols ABC transporter, permease component 2 n=1 Tax=Candidatus Rhodobacter oscarellae TaxID=1675527 RepID=A0A0J9E986_9RHOB|nr:carbohydrate ABC transporter permease [Candidatus Rhodobacter lobularis]KMW59357.1 Various polyols ABC transporter, permease component 2 [Candidatus Rhodobacter lobularis]